MTDVSATDQLAALAELADALSEHGIGYWLFGGWAVDFYVGHVTREHADIDIAVWTHDAPALSVVLRDREWQHSPEPGEDGYTCYVRTGVRLEVAFLARDETGVVYTPLRDGRGEWPANSFGDAVAVLHGVRAHLVSRESLVEDKSAIHANALTTAKDRADLAVLRLVSGMPPA